MRFRHSAPFVIVVAIAAGCLSQHDPQAATETGADNAAVDALFASWDVPGSPGCALAVARDEILVYSRGYGYANLDYDLPVTPQTAFDVASITKQFNAASLTLLALEGKLSLDDDVREWLPELPAYETQITLRHMLHHTSGLRDYLTLFPLAGRDDYYPISHPQILAMMSRQRALNFPPGDRYSYSNSAYMLLAQVVERAGGESLGEMTRRRFFEPLGMNDSVMYENREQIIPRRATGYDRDDDGYRVVHNYNFDVVGDGQLYSTVEDLLRWDDYLHGDDKPEINAWMLTEGQLNNGEPTGYALGLRLDEYRGLETVGHSGSSWGFRSQLVRFVEPALSIAIACNADSSRPGDLAERVADLYLADLLAPVSDDEEPESDREESREEPAQATLSPMELQAFSGAFFSPELDATYRFRVVDGGLVLRIEQEPPVAVVPVGDREFEFDFHPPGWSGPMKVRLNFVRDGHGTVTGFALSTDAERGIVFERL